MMLIYDARKKFGVIKYPFSTIKFLLGYKNSLQYKIISRIIQKVFPEHDKDLIAHIFKEIDQKEGVNSFLVENKKERLLKN